MLFGGLLGKLSWHALSHPLVTMGAAIGTVLGALTIAVAITFFKKWP